jgi:UDP-N-acetylmuramate dehydrogenase
MPTASFGDRLAVAIGADRVSANVPLGPFTTFRVGGPADWLAQPGSAAEIVSALRLAHAEGVAVTMLGGGSNVLVGDRGIRGLVIRPRGGAIEIAGDRGVRAEAAVTLNGVVRWTVGRGLSGLEAWAGTPGTVGGAVCGNAHYGGRLIGERVEAVRLVSLDGWVSTVAGDAMEFGYDRSRLQRTGEVLLWAVFRVTPGADPAALREVARQSLAHRKRTQPLDVASAGCIFQNPGPDESVPDGVPRSAGALIDRAGLKGVRLGGALVSTVHANFIVNPGSATAADIRALVQLCRQTVADRFGVRLHEEIVYLGDF